jgi:carbon monoxide dehydrogenase subunit G
LAESHWQDMTQESSDDQQPQVDLDALAAKVGEMLLPEINKAVTGMGTRLKKEVEGSVTGSIGDVVKDQLGTTLEKLLAGAASKSDAPPQPDSQPKADEKDDKLTEFIGKVEALQQQNNSLAQRLQQEESARQQAEAARQRSELETSFYDAVRDKVHDPQQFLLSLERFAGVQERDNKFVVATKDDWGNIQEKPAVELVDEFLKQQKFSIHAKPRGGNGLGSAPSNGNPPNGKSGSKLFGEGNRNSEAVFDAIVKSPEGLDAVISDLLKTAE